MTALPDIDQSDGDEVIWHFSDSYAITPEPLFHDISITDGAVRLYQHMAWVAGKRHSNWSARESMAARFEVSETTITNRLNELIAKDWIVAHFRKNAKGRTSNIYHVFQVQESAINWRTLQEIKNDKSLLAKPEARTHKTRKGIGGKPSHEGKATQVDELVSKPELIDPLLNPSSQEQDQVSNPKIEQDQVSNPSPESLSEAQASDGGAVAKQSDEAQPPSASPAPERSVITVVNIKTVSGKVEDHPGYVYCGRWMGEKRPASIWQNPHKVGLTCTRLEAVGEYLYELLINKELLSQLNTLRGKTLVCWCSPDLCHCDGLKILAEMEGDQRAKWIADHMDLTNGNDVLAALMAESSDPDLQLRYTKAKVSHASEMAVILANRKAIQDADKKAKVKPYKASLNPADGPKPATPIKDSVREVIDAYYDGFPAAIRPPYRKYTGNARSTAEKWLQAAYTPAQMKACVADQYRDPAAFWPQQRFVMPITTVLENAALWISQLSTQEQAATGDGESRYLQDPFFKREDRDDATFAPLAPAMDRQIDQSLVTWWLAERGQLKVQLNKTTFNLYIKHLKLVEAHDNRFWLEAPGRMEKQHIEKNMMHHMQEALAQFGLKDRSRWEEIEITLEIDGQAQPALALESTATP